MERSFKRGRNICFAAAVLVFLFSVPLATLLVPKREVSGIENRELAQIPEYTEESFFSGEYFLAWESYFKDHIFARDIQIFADTWLKLNALDRSAVNGILKTDTVLLPHLTAPTSAADSTAQAEAMGDRLALLQKTVEAYGGTLLYVGVPTQMTAYADAFPQGAYSGSNDRAANAAAFAAALERRGIDFLDMAEVFAENGGASQYYMRTDHHYTLKGAYLVYRAICGQLALPLVSEADFTFSALKLRFLGSRSRAIYYLSDLTDEVFIAEWKDPISFTRQDNGAEVAARVFHLPDPAESTVTYSLYMGGDIAETVISTDRTELPNVLIFGDSYTNAVETLLYTSCNEMRSLDLRHYNQMTLTAYVERYRPDIVICLRDDNNYLVDTGNGNIQ